MILSGLKYFTVFKEKSIDSYEFKSTFLNFFADDAELSSDLKRIDWDTWFYKAGLPPKPDFDSSLVDVVYDLARKWQSLPDSSFEPSKDDTKSLLSNQQVVFLEQVLLFEKPLTPELSKLMGEVYGFAHSTNYEVANVYLQVGLKARDRSVIEPTVSLLGKTGRMKFVRPLYVFSPASFRRIFSKKEYHRYRALKELDPQIATDTFEKYRLFYHPICRNMVEKDLFGGNTA